LVSGGNKARVRDLYSALGEAAAQAGIRNRFFSIVDNDFSERLSADPGSKSEFTWDVYHIENYLLDAGSIRAATTALLGNDLFGNEANVLASLRTCAEELLDSLVLELLQNEVNSLLIRAVRVGGPPDTKSPAADLLPSVRGSIERVASLQQQMGLADLEIMASHHRGSLEAGLRDDGWLRTFPGRSLMRRFSAKHLEGRVYASVFHNTVLDKMVERKVEPASMKAVFGRILET